MINSGQAGFAWQILAPIGISGTSRIGAPSTEEPQLTSKLEFLPVKQERFAESGFVALAAMDHVRFVMDDQ